MKFNLTKNGLYIPRYNAAGVEISPHCMTVDQARRLRNYLNLNYQNLRPDKIWNKCPYESHTDDCDCGGSGGDR